MHLGLAGASAFLLVAIAASSSAVRAQHASRDPIARLDVLLTTAPTLPASARLSMMSEAAEIWRKHGVAIDWLPPTADKPRGPNQLRVLVVQRRPQVNDPQQPFAVGELVRAPGSQPVAVISIEGAQRLMASMRGRAGYELIVVDERRLGVVLGRALAHEIGHYVLDTHTHAQSGLMRPQFSANEFCDLREGAFALDADAAAWLRTREVDKFAYAR
jgi:hypothetical protein